MNFQSLTRVGYRALPSPAPVALMFFCLFALAGCGGGGGGSSGGASAVAPDDPVGQIGERVETENPGGVGIQARLAAHNAPNEGSVTQSSNGTATVNSLTNEVTPGTTTDFVVIDQTRASDGTYTFTLTKNTPDGEGWSIGSAEDIEDIEEVDEQDADDRFQTFYLYKRFGDDTPDDPTDDGTLYADFSTDIQPAGSSDTDWLAGGLWLYLPDDDQLTSVADAENIEIGAYLDGNDPFRRTRLASLTGMATYTGSADGVYVEVDGEPDDLDGEIDTFDGDLTLMAAFGNPTQRGSISGVFTNIITGEDEDDESLSAQEKILTAERDGLGGPASLMFRQAMITDTDGGFFTGELSGRVDGIDFAGQWGGQFFGNDDANPTDHPDTVAGTFGGTGTDPTGVTFIGIFGLDLDEESSP